MQALKTIAWALAAAALAAAGCERQDATAAQPQPIQQVVQQPAPAQQLVQPVGDVAQPQYVVVEQAPPPLQVEVQPAPPSADVVWIGGFWDWNNTSYSWRAGHYERPPEPNVTWVAPRYEGQGKNGHFTPGRWSPGAGRRGR